jgi:AAA domain-containing protein
VITSEMLKQDVEQIYKLGYHEPAELKEYIKNFTYREALAKSPQPEFDTNLDSAVNDFYEKRGLTLTAPAITQETASAKQTTVESEDPGPLTRHEAMEIVQKRVAEDDQYEEPTTFEELIEILQGAADVRGSEISTSAFKDIVAKYAPNAPHRNETSEQAKDEPNYSYPPELESLVKSGVAVFETTYDGHWLVNRCDKCGQFKNKCCGSVSLVGAVRDDGKTLTSFGRQAVGLDPIKPPKPPKTLEEIQQDIIRKLPENPWWKDFSGTDELQGSASVKMLIENFLPEGLTLICGLPKEGKSFLALSVAKALTSGKPLFGRPGFEVPEIVPVLYLAAESGDSALKLRCEKMHITNDKTQFICRTLSKGLMLSLDDPALEQAIKAMRPAIVLETMIRFNDGTDEDSSTENRKLAESLFRLIAWGARAVIGIHHSRKDLNKTNPTKESAVRGSGDGLAMVDCVWLIMQDERMYQGGKGPNEVNLIGWGRDFNPVPMRLALTKKAPKDAPAVKTFAPGIVSCVDSSGDFEWVDRRLIFEQAQRSAESIKQTVERMVAETPTVTRAALTEKTGLKEWQVRKVLKQLGYHRGKGDGAATEWVRTVAN